MATPSVPTTITRDDVEAIPHHVYKALENVWNNLDACMPTIEGLLDHLGNTDEARTFYLVQKALGEAHTTLTTVVRGA